MPQPPFYTDKVGVEQGRVINPQGFTPPEGEAALVLGSDEAGHFRRFNVGDRIDVFQSDTPDAASKLLKFATRAIGPSRMPSVTSGDETFTLADTENLLVKVDDGTQQNIVFDAADFSDITNATADEVVVAINAQLQGATAFNSGLRQVGILSNRTGRFSRVQIVGGSAQVGLDFEEWAWRAVLLLNDIEVNAVELYPGRVQNFDEWGANLLGFATPTEIKFRLEVIAK